MNLDLIKVILVSPQSGGNVGSIARLCRNFGVQKLVIVDPRFDTNDELMQKLAVGEAKTILKQIAYEPSLSSALKDTQMAMAFTGQQQRWHRPIEDLNLFLNSPASKHIANNQVSLVFGREDSGLTSDELNHCHYSFYIPTHPQQPSLNLSHAVAIVLAQFFTKNPPETPTETKRELNDETLASHKDYERLLEAWNQILFSTKMNVKDGNLDRVIFHSRQYFLRTMMSKREMGFAMLCFSKIQGALGVRRLSNRQKNTNK